MGKDLNGKELGTGISQRPNGLYMARFVDPYKTRHTFYGENLKELKRRLEKVKYEYEHGVGGTGDNVLLNEWFEEYIKLYKIGRVKNTTVFRIRQTYSSCSKDVLGSMRLNQICAIHIQNYINRLHEEGYSYGTLNMIKSLLNEMFKAAMGNGMVMRNPIDAVVLPKKEKYEARYLTEREQEMFFEAAKEYGHYDVFCANISCGARIGELLGLKWSDIDFEKKTICIQRTLHYAKLSEDDMCHFFFTTPKTDTSERTIPLLPEMETVLRRVRKKQLTTRMLHAVEWNQESPFEDMVFTASNGSPLRYGDVNRTIKKAIVKANLQEKELAKFENREPLVLKEFSPHCFRHTFVTRCKMHGVPYEIIQLYVGHSNKEMTMYYDHNKLEIGVKDFDKVSLLGAI